MDPTAPPQLSSPKQFPDEFVKCPRHTCLQMERFLARNELYKEELAQYYAQHPEEKASADAGNTPPSAATPFVWVEAQLRKCHAARTSYSFQ